MSSADHTPTNLLRTRLRRTASALGATLALALAGCGGGDQVSTFKPERMVSFGDEASTLETLDLGTPGSLKGQKYTINSVLVFPNYDDDLATYIDLTAQVPTGGTLSDTQAAFVAFPDAATYVASSLLVYDSTQTERTFNLPVAYTDSGNAAQTFQANIRYQYLHACVNNRLWIQLVANAYGLGYQSQCPDDSAGAVSHAAAQARVADVVSQIDTHLGELTDKTLVTVQAGQNDVLDLYDDVTAGDLSEDAARNELRARGRTLGQALNRIMDRGARILIMTVPDLSFSPYARAGGSAGMARMQALVVAFNEGLLGTGSFNNNGNLIARVKGYEQIQTMAENASSYGLVNVSDAACEYGRRADTATYDRVEASDTSLDYGLYCNTFTLRSGATSTNYLWATSVHLSPAAHASLGNLAYTRAQDNPF